MKHQSPFEQGPYPPQQHFTLAETNHLQLELMKNYEGGELHWVETYSEAFRELIEQEPHLHELYEHDAHACFEYIKKCLEKPTHH
jgi:hypothetical protein